ncbi:bifunctional phosphopantothenoylcysteine decarboxylase/phosphopantothenate--cysteine ligase CoaBC [Granulicella arctica]|uniref:bifunctional phosphopantothenoylcysteine decarboxylase/phosphopantothenate--cysteine ligase CoaBC n=1 Tax=Granulicella arctica TaxID=940613 RepID=UPI0021DF59B7|nr:bifunctional phosphopantothenoylcysteine decarboxylase/phosphopantothenate--cysteine ligase CoaBC [Granulicella arctica]
MSVKITVGVTGGIAAYKAVELVRALQTAGLDPHVVMTRAAQQFVTPLTFAAITGHRVITTLWANDDSESNLNSAIDHIDEAQTTHALIVAPATADILAKFAHGLAEDFLSTLYLATKAPVLVAPAMNVNMWTHPATQANLEVLRTRGVHIIEPDNGYLACGMVGSGRLADTPIIVEAVLQALTPTQDLAAETILITAGGTREPLDPVRFLGNRSSGKMGYALATAALARGARVLLVSASTSLNPPPNCEFLPVTTAAEMHTAVLKNLTRATVVIGAAAVADFRPATVSAEKLRRTGPLTLTLEPTPDILAEAAIHRAPDTLIIAFAAETDSAAALENGRAKLLRKGANAIVINDVSRPGLGFDADHNAATLLTPAHQVDLAPMTKLTMANEILKQITLLRATSPLTPR